MSMRRTAKRYLGGSKRSTRNLQEVLNENPALVAAGGLLLNAMLQSKYGTTLQQLLNPGAGTAAKPAKLATEEAAAPEILAA